MSKVSDIDSLVAKLRWVLIVLAVAFCHALAGCSREHSRGSGGNGLEGGHMQQHDWEKFVYQCISTVEKSDAVFYRRGQPVSGRELAKQMRRYLDAIVRDQTVHDPFGQNVATVLVLITTHEGIWRDGLTDKPEACEVQVGDRRIPVYLWLKQELGVPVLPGEGGYVRAQGYYEAEITPEIVAKWNQYITECIRAVRQAEGYRFDMKGKVCSPDEAAAILEANRAAALDRLHPPLDLTPKEQELLGLYSPDAVIHELITRPMPTNNPAEWTEWGRHFTWVIDPTGERRLLALWLEDKVGEPPPMPKLKKKGKGSP